MATPSTRMRAVIFAGGIGSRMWPLSRKKSPKQFEPIIEGKSTLQLTVERVRPEIAWEDIFISTGQQYVELIKQQLPEIPEQNIIGEPEMRDIGPAVGYLMKYLAATDPDCPTAILWSDHLVERVDVFKDVLFCGAEYLQKNPNRYIFIGQKPRFANQNLGWIEYGEVIDQVNGFEVKQFVSWHYRPSQEVATGYFNSGKHAWNPGYFVVTPRFVLDQFKLHAPAMTAQLDEIAATFGQPNHRETLERIYPTMEKISFDDAIVTKTEPEQAVVLAVDLGWSDVGTWEALKEAVLKNPTENLEHGLVKTLDAENNVIYSYTDQLVVGMGIRGMAVIVTKDAILVTPQTKIPDIKKVLSSFEGTELERYT